jgi:hypothetical protein
MRLVSRSELDDAVGDGPDEPEVVLDEHEREAAAADPVEQLREALDLEAARARRGLVEQEDPRRRGERGGEHQQPLLEAVEAGRGESLQVVELDEPERTHGDALDLGRVAPCLRRGGERPQRAAVAAVEARAHDRVLEHGQAREDGGALERPNDAGASAPRLARREWCAREQDVAAIGGERAGERPQRSRLARSVRPDERDRLPRRDAQVEVLERRDAAEVEREPARVQLRRRLARRRKRGAEALVHARGSAARGKPRPDPLAAEREQAQHEDAREQRLELGRRAALDRGPPAREEPDPAEERDARRPARRRRGAAEQDGDEQLEGRERPERREIGDAASCTASEPARPPTAAAAANEPSRSRTRGTPSAAALAGLSRRARSRTPTVLRRSTAKAAIAAAVSASASS